MLLGRRQTETRESRSSEGRRREAKARRATRQIDWVTEIIRTMIGSDARFVERFFLAGRLFDTVVGGRVSVFFENEAIKGHESVHRREDTIAERVLLWNKDRDRTQRAFRSSISLNDGDITAPQ